MDQSHATRNAAGISLLATTGRGALLGVLVTVAASICTIPAALALGVIFGTYAPFGVLGGLVFVGRLILFFSIVPGTLVLQRRM